MPFRVCLQAIFKGNEIVASYEKRVSKCKPWKTHGLAFDLRNSNSADLGCAGFDFLPSVASLREVRPLEGSSYSTDRTLLRGRRACRQANSAGMGAAVMLQIDSKLIPFTGGCACFIVW